MFNAVNKRFDAVVRLAPFYNRKCSGRAIAGLMRWENSRQKPRLWHYVIRWYRRRVLARKEWRLPWR